MAAGDAFTWVPNRVTKLRPIHPVRVTESESAKKVKALADGSPIERFRLLFKGASVTDRDAIWSHFADQDGSLTSFSWTSVPAYINGGSNITCRYLDEEDGDSVVEEPRDHYKWRMVIILEKVVA